jgi:hypothetical protein
MIFKTKTKFDLSKFCIIFIAIVVIYTQLNLKYWQRKESVICWDIISYYAYLPATFIYHDISLDFMDSYKGNHEFVFWPLPLPNGKKLIKTSMGLSVLYAPFFFIGHIMASNSNYDAGGYSAPYKFMLLVSSFFYLLIGLYYLRKTLLLYFSNQTTAITLLLIFFATNLHYYSTIEATMSHVYNFGLISAFIWYTSCWHKTPSFRYSTILGILSGLISLVRPTNSLIAIVFILWEINSIKELKNRIVSFAKKWFDILIIILLAIIIWIPQLLYWKMQTGNYFYFSYGPDENFFFSNPHIFNGLFSFRKGWFIYTPIMIFAVIGVFFMYGKTKNLRLSIILFLILNIYVILSWWCWWYGGCFGQRSFIDSYSLMAIPLGAFLSRFQYSKKISLRRIIIAFTIVFLLHGIYQTAQYYYGAIHWDAMTYKAYIDSFGRVYPSGNMDKLLKAPDYKFAKKGIEEN